MFLGVTYIHPCLKQLRYQKKLQVAHSTPHGREEEDVEDDQGDAGQELDKEAAEPGKEEDAFLVITHQKKVMK